MSEQVDKLPTEVESNEQALARIWREHEERGKQKDTSMKEEIQKKCLLTAGWPLGVSRNKMYWIMSKYGKIHTMRQTKDKSRVIFRYHRTEDAEKLIIAGFVHAVNKDILIVSLKQMHQVFPTVSASHTLQNQAFLLKVLQETSLDDELEVLLELCQNREEIRERRFEVFKDLEEVINCKFPGSTLHPFGSAIIGLAFPDADLDFFVSLSSPSNQNVAQDIAVKSVYKFANTLSTNKQFSKVIKIAHAKTPILKCTHNKTEINCDITFKSIMGVRNTHLFKFIVNLDEKIRTCLLVLKYWLRSRQLTGKAHQFTSYALMTMFVFYLQQPPIHFPRIMDLQKNASEHNWVSMWNCGFDENHAVDLSACRSMTYHNLLIGFFEFYSTFEFQTFAVVPFLGKPVLRKCFEDRSQIPPEFVSLIEHPEELKALRLGNVLVQDVFEHSRNTTGGVNKAILREFQQAALAAVSIFQSKTEHILYKLLDNCDEEGNFQKICIQLPSSRFMLFSTHSCIKCVNLEEIQRSFFRIVKERLLYVLADILTLQTAEKISNPLDMACESYGISFECKGTFNVLGSKNKSKSNHVKAIINVENVHVGACVIVTLETIDAKEETDVEFEYFASYLRLYLPQYLNDYYKQLEMSDGGDKLENVCKCKA